MSRFAATLLLFALACPVGVSAQDGTERPQDAQAPGVENYLRILRQRAPDDHARLLARFGGVPSPEAVIWSQMELAEHSMSAPDPLVRDALQAHVGISRFHADDPKLCIMNLAIGVLPPEALEADLPRYLEAQERMLVALLAGRDDPEPASVWGPDGLRSDYQRTVDEFATNTSNVEAARIVTDLRNDGPDQCKAFLVFFDYVITSDTPQALLMRRLFLAVLAARGSLLAFMVK